MPKKSPAYYKQLYSPSNLSKAWSNVKKNGQRSQSELTRDDIKKFDDSGAAQRLKIIHTLLKTNKFIFSQARGVAISRKGKAPRPVVVATIEDRIVQRALLNVLQKNNKIDKLLKNKTSFGGVEGRSVSDALQLIAEKNSSAKFFARSDIVSFFTKIPQAEVYEKIVDALSSEDEAFNKILLNAMKVVLVNKDALGEDYALFPNDETGVAQGSCLSPLFGNILLSDFDKLSNSKEVTCVRFVDDYVILGPTESSVREKFKHGKAWLRERDFDVYDPYKENLKGESGSISGGFDFLGCTIHRGRISPSQKAVNSLKNRIRVKIHESLNSKNSFAETIISIRNIMQGWGNSYKFANNHELIESLDQTINEEVKRYFIDYVKSLEAITNPADLVQSLGIRALKLCKTSPIYPLKPSTKEKTIKNPSR